MKSQTLPKGLLSISAALLLALWEIYFFWFSGLHVLGPLDGSVGVFTSDRIGINLAWLVLVYLSIQLFTIPFSLPHTGGRFIGVFDMLASLVPLAVVIVAIVAKGPWGTNTILWEPALLLLAVSLIDLLGGTLITIALSRRVTDFQA